jgi:hypothetical protein
MYATYKPGSGYTILISTAGFVPIKTYAIRDPYLSYNIIFSATAACVPIVVLSTADNVSFILHPARGCC